MKNVVKAKAIVSRLWINQKMTLLSHKGFELTLLSTGRFNMKELALMAGKTVKVTLEVV